LCSGIGLYDLGIQRPLSASKRAFDPLKIYWGSLSVAQDDDIDHFAARQVAGK
jgi:hypothetical protein